MTLIIGARFKDGVVLVSDRKVIEENSGRVTFENKLTAPLNVFLVLGAAGYSHKFKQFNRRIIEIVEERLRQIQIDNIAFLKQRGLEYNEKKKRVKEQKQLSNRDIEGEANIKEVELSKKVPEPFAYTHEMFIKDCGDLIYELCKGRDDIIRPDLDVLLIRFAGQPKLHHINFLGEEEELNYCAIGSGAEYIENFLRDFWREEMSIEEILKLCYFCIYYVQDLDLDKSVGIEEGKLPDHSVITHGGAWGEFTGFKNRENEIIEEVRREIRKFKDIIVSLPFAKNEIMHG